MRAHREVCVESENVSTDIQGFDVSAYLSRSGLFIEASPASAPFAVASLNEEGSVLGNRIVRGKVRSAEQKLGVVGKVVCCRKLAQFLNPKPPQPTLNNRGPFIHGWWNNGIDYSRFSPEHILVVEVQA